MRLYCAESGYFGTEWHDLEPKLFRTKKEVHQYMKDRYGYGFYPNQYFPDCFESQVLQKGYHVVSFEFDADTKSVPADTKDSNPILDVVAEALQ